MKSENITKQRWAIFCKKLFSLYQRTQGIATFWRDTVENIVENSWCRFRESNPSPSTCDLEYRWATKTVATTDGSAVVVTIYSRNKLWRFWKSGVQGSHSDLHSLWDIVFVIKCPCNSVLSGTRQIFPMTYLHVGWISALEKTQWGVSSYPLRNGDFKTWLRL